MSEEALIAAADLETVRRLTEELKETQRRLSLAQHQLDNERRLTLGRYAFYHRHLAMGFVRKRDPELANWASSEAGHRIDQEGGKSFEDVVARLEAERDQFRAALELAAPVVCSMLCPTVWKTSEGPRPHSETCQTITKLLEGGTTL